MKHYIHRVVIDFVVQGGGYDENFAELFLVGYFN